MRIHYITILLLLTGCSSSELVKNTVHNEKYEKHIDSLIKQNKCETIKKSNYANDLTIYIHDNSIVRIDRISRTVSHSALSIPNLANLKYIIATDYVGSRYGDTHSGPKIEMSKKNEISKLLEILRKYSYIYKSGKETDYFYENGKAPYSKYSSSNSKTTPKLVLIFYDKNNKEIYRITHTSENNEFYDSKNYQFYNDILFEHIKTFDKKFF